MAKKTLADLHKAIVAFRDARDWKQFHNPKDSAISLALEAAEVLEHVQWKNADDMQKYAKEHKEDIAEELADVLYWVILMSNDLDIDILDTSFKKLKKNDEKYPVAKAKGKATKYTSL
jgi:dCTP diphosphatase